MSVFGLKEILHPLSTREFLRDYWPDKHAVCHGPIDRLKRITSVPEIQNLDAFAQSYHQKVKLWFAPSKETELSKRVHLKSVDAETAVAYYELGATIYASNIAGEIPALREINRQIEKDLELPPGASVMELFASKAGAGTPPHFDHELNINIQLTGRKSWTVAENAQAPHPLSHYKPCEGPPSGEAELYIPKGLPNKMPSNSTTFETGPGSVVFLPQGYWHTTKALTDSIAISIVLIPSSWIDILLRAVKKRAIVHPEWRRRVLPNTVDDRRIDQLVSQLPKILGGIGADEIKRAAAKKRGQTFKLTDGLKLKIAADSAAGAKASQLRIDAPGEDTRRIKIPPSLVPVMRWLIRQEAEFDFETVYANAGMVPSDGVRKILKVLMDAGILTSGLAAY